MQKSQSRLFFQKPVLWIAIFLMFGLGLAVRLYDLTDLPLDFHSTRQMHSAIIARGMFYQHLDAPQWQRELAVSNWYKEGLIEPPFLEWLTAQTYRLTGVENLWYARLYSIFFWMAGAAAVYLFARDLAGAGGALVGLAYYLFLQYGTLASRAFQPDPLMTALIAFSMWAMNRWYQKQTWRWAVTAGLIGGLAILSKAVAVFFVGGAWLGLMLLGYGLKRALRSRQVWLLGVLTVLPYGMFHIYGVYISGELSSQFGLRFFPQLWLDPVFYLQWKGMIASTLRFEWFAVALLAVFALQKMEQRALLAGAWTGYFVYGMALSYHISTHDYYQVPMIPLVALGLAVAAGVLFRNLQGPRWLFTALSVGVVLLFIVTEAWDARVALKRQDYRSESAFWGELASHLDKGAEVVGLTQDYGYRLSYWGWVSSANWMSSSDFNNRALAGQDLDVVKIFAEDVAGKSYFVVSMLPELERQPKLKSLLEKNYPVIHENDDYKIFDLRYPLSTQ